MRVTVTGASGSEAIALPTEPLSDGSRLALCGGLGLYLGGVAAFRGRMLGTVTGTRLLGAALPLVLFAVSPGWAANWVLAAAVVVLGFLSALETLERHSTEVMP